MPQQGPTLTAKRADDPQPPSTPGWFYRQLPGALAYPLRAWSLILTGAIAWAAVGAVITIVANGVILRAMAFVLAVLAAGYVAAFAMKVLGSSAAGEAHPPDWPGVSDLWDDLLRPLLLMLGAALMAFLPLLLCPVYLLWRFFTAPSPSSGGPPFVGGALLSPELLYSLLALGLLYLPMALIAVSLFDGPAGLNPAVVVGGMIRTGVSYLVAVVVTIAVAALVGGINWLLAYVPILGPFFSAAVTLYLLMLEMRILGLLYLSAKDRLWFDGL
jgi:hypothetical protein